MNEKRTYPITIAENNSVIEQHTVEAADRKTAVRKGLQWFWDKYQGKRGAASEVFTVGDPYGEVTFREPWNSNDKGNNYLDEATASRVIIESKGVLERDTKEGSRHHPRRSLRRKKRRREYRVTVAPNIQESDTGTFYYRVVITAQKSEGGNILTKRKMEDVRLEAKNLTEAIDEIRRRGLKNLHERNTARKHVKIRSLKLVEHVAVGKPLSDDDRRFFAPVLKKLAAV